MPERLGGGAEQYSFQFEEPPAEPPAPEQAKPSSGETAEQAGAPRLHERDDTGEYWTSYRDFRRPSGGGRRKLRPRKG